MVNTYIYDLETYNKTTDELWILNQPQKGNLLEAVPYYAGLSFIKIDKLDNYLNGDIPIGSIQEFNLLNGDVLV